MSKAHATKKVPTQGCAFADDASAHPLIVIDVGHGYIKGPGGPYDSGAVATTDDGKTVHEYTLNLAVAKKLKPLFEAQGFEVLLTQNGDHTPLASRFQARLDYGRDCANKVMHLVVHHNKVKNNSSRHGFAAFYHRDAGSDSLSADWARRMEREFTGHLSPDGPTHDTSLIQTGSFTSPNYREWDVTRGLGPMPAVLVEAGYMSNTDDLAHMIQPQEQQRTAERIVAASVKFYDAAFAAGKVNYARIPAQSMEALARIGMPVDVSDLIAFELPAPTFDIDGTSKASVPTAYTLSAR
jgi:N-acetylmuramoyl-L-alanine amidase